MDAQRMENHRLAMERLCTYMTTSKYWDGATATDKKRIRNQSKRHKIKDGVLIYVSITGEETEVITSIERVADILEKYHTSQVAGGHSGIEATIQKITSLYRWGSVKDDVIYYIKRCPVCQKHETIKTQAPVMTPIKVTEPLELVEMDYMGPLKRTKAGNRYILTMIDHFTKFVELYPMPSKLPLEVCRKILSFVRRYGTPKRLLSDRGGEFVNKANMEMCQMLNIKRSVSSAYHPQTNGLVERMNKTVKTRCSKLVEQYNCDWDEVVKDVAVTIRCQKQKSTKYSPFFLMFGRKPRYIFQMEEADKDTDVVIIPSGDEEPEDDEPALDVISAETDDSETEDLVPQVFSKQLLLAAACNKERVSYVSERKELMKKVFPQVVENQELASKRQKEAYAQQTSKGVKTFDFKVGDLVLRQNLRNKGRHGDALDKPWIGPFRIVDINTHNRVQLTKEGSNGQLLRARVPYDQLKPYLEGLMATHVQNQPDSTSHIQREEIVEQVPVAAQNSALRTSASHVGVGNVDNYDDDDDFVAVKMNPRKQPGTHHSKVKRSKERATQCTPRGSEKDQRSKILNGSSNDMVFVSDNLKKVEPQGTLPCATKTQERSWLMSLNKKESTITNVTYEDVVSDKKRRKTQKSAPVHDDDVVFSTMFGPKRREAQPLPIVPAERQTHSIAEMKRILDTKRELSDLHIDHFSALLKEQFPAIDGLQMLAVFQSQECQRVGTPKGKCVQVLHVGNHWVTVSNIHCSQPGEVMVYDSLFDTVREEFKGTFLQQLGWLLFTDAQYILVKLVNVQKQQGSVTCGLFALAFAHALCAGLRPEEHTYFEEFMWVHLSNCLDSEILQPFPVQPWPRKIIGKELHGQLQEEVFCICRQPNYPQMAMVACDSCNKWFHCQCMNITETKVPKYFVCNVCKR